MGLGKRLSAALPVLQQAGIGQEKSNALHSFNTGMNKVAQT
jgi:hypothetical protein